MDAATGKKCKGCGVTKLLEAFAKADGCINGRRGECKECLLAKRYAWMKTPEGKMSVKKYLLSDKRKAAKRRFQVSAKGQAAMRLNYCKRRSDPESVKKATARNMLNNMIIAGKISKPTECESCKKSGVKIQGHHYAGYEKENWYTVKWLCEDCHWIEHGR